MVNNTAVPLGNLSTSTPNWLIDEFNAWIRKRQGNVKALAALWNAKDYQGMIELMENAADPGPINGEKPSDHE